MTEVKMTDFGENFKELCRLCASLETVKMDIFGERARERNLVDKIHTCMPFKVSYCTVLILKPSLNFVFYNINKYSPADIAARKI